MKITKAGYQLIDDKSITRKIERVARVCYKSEDRIRDGTDIKMCRVLIANQHTAMLEHGNLILEVGEWEFNVIGDLRDSMENYLDYDAWRKCYLRFTVSDDEKYTHPHFVVSGNIRAWYEFMLYANKRHNLPKKLYDIVNGSVNNIFNIDVTKFEDDTYVYDYSGDFYAKVITDMSTLTDEERMVHDTFSVLFTVDRGVTHELIRMRDCSFAQESTRYVSSSKKSIEVNSEDDVLYLYENAGMSMKKIADKSNGNFTEWDIYKILESNDVKKRNLGSRGIINETYFETIDTPEKAFLLGFITADGSMRRDLKQLTISQKESESWWILNMIRNFIQPDAKSLTITNEKICNDLYSKGIIPNKTYDFTKEHIDLLWSSIPNELKYDFIRGLLDGDGNIRWFYQTSTSKTMSCNIGFTGNKYLLQKITELLTNDFNYKPKLYEYEHYARMTVTDSSVGKLLCERMYDNFVFPYGHSKTIRYYEAFNLTIPCDISVPTIRDFNVIIPFMFTNPDCGSMLWAWGSSMLHSEISYKNLIELGAKPQEARDVLPTSVKADIVMTTNLAEWKHIFNLRACDSTGPAHPQMKEIMVPLLKEMQKKYPFAFGDLIPAEK